MYDRVYNTGKKEKTILEFENRFEKEEYNFNKIIMDKEIELIKRVMSLSGGNKTRAAELLGIPRQTLKYKIDKYKLN